jgi:UDP-N-acetyl-D-mannosaminuronic acid dehydrogenase
MTSNILVIGGGFVGLTLAAKLLKTKSCHVTILENNPSRFLSLKNEKYYVDEPGLHEILEAGVSDLRLNFIDSVSSDLFDSVFVCIGTLPTFISEESSKQVIDLTHVVGKALKRNGLVFLRSTVTIGATQTFADQLKILERSDAQVFFLPERTAEGVALAELDSLPQIIGPTVNTNVSDARVYLTELGFELIECSDSRAAEFVKLICNAWRDTVFGISNEIALMAEQLGLDSAEIISAANNKYPRANIPSPGPVSGPCLFKDSHILLESFNKSFRDQSIIGTARSVNEKVESKIYERLSAHLDKSNLDREILFIGAAFKGFPKTNDIRNGVTANIVKKIQDGNKPILIKIWDPTLGIESLNELSIYSVDTLVGMTPSVVVIGNNSNELMTNEVMTLFANLSEETLIIDPWRSYTDSDDSSADLYHLGLGMA